MPRVILTSNYDVAQKYVGDAVTFLRGCARFRPQPRTVQDMALMSAEFTLMYWAKARVDGVDGPLDIVEVCWCDCVFQLTRCLSVCVRASFSVAWCCVCVCCCCPGVCVTVHVCDAGQAPFGPHPPCTGDRPGHVRTHAARESHSTVAPTAWARLATIGAWPARVRVRVRVCVCVCNR
jgi:hypothetical protein